MLILLVMRWIRAVIFNVVHLGFLVVHKEFHKSFIKLS